MSDDPRVEPPPAKAGDLVDLKALLRRKPESLCDPECEGRCRTCPREYVDELLALVATLNDQAKSALDALLKARVP